MVGLSQNEKIALTSAVIENAGSRVGSKTAKSKDFQSENPATDFA